jgi:hypothetical protein
MEFHLYFMMVMLIAPYIQFELQASTKRVAADIGSHMVVIDHWKKRFTFLKIFTDSIHSNF